MEPNEDLFETAEYLEDNEDTGTEHFYGQQKPPLPSRDDSNEEALIEYVDEVESCGRSRDDDDTGMLKTDLGNHLYFFQGSFHRRLYRGQMRPRDVGNKNVVGDSIDDVMKCIWGFADKHVSRQIEFDNNGPKWAAKIKPDREDIEKFITLQDQIKRKSYSTCSITSRLLTSWRGEQIKIFIHSYSVNVETNAQHQMVLKQLLSPNNPDRSVCGSGAYSTYDDAALATELKESHPELEGHHSSWLLWANTIHSSPAHKQEEMKTAPAPPLELAKYIRWTGVSEAARLQSVHRGASVARTVNSSWMIDAEEIYRGLTSAIFILSNIAQKLDKMLYKGKAAEEIIVAVQSAVRPVESEISTGLADSVSNCPDIDHI
ncbi:uncharacterized protein LOC131434398 [Malaya genurostris]|uniref:uncharacterized protein LOC131434398 n=1 Tax=Malaya genurostris TaxID=325434 RepID=UPI0026F38792|nr:uncharacterized protein LOC131434398 [Malaya genurostris]